MSENGKTSATDAENTTPADVEQPADDTLITDPPENAEASEQDAASPPEKKRFGPWLFLLLIFIGLPLAWFFSPPEMQQQAGDVLTRLMAQITPAKHAVEQTPAVPSTTPTTTQTSEPATDIAQQSATTTTETAVPENETMPDKHEPPMPPARIENMAESNASEAENMREMREGLIRFQHELTAVQFENRDLREQIEAHQKQTLSILLRLLVQPQTRLAQHAELWNDIASLAIDEEGKNVAKLMAKLANDNLSLIKTWRQALIRLADSIPDTAPTDILPRPENKYIAWLIGTFHLRPAASEPALMQASLKHRLLDMEHAFSLGVWPEQKEWRALMTALHDQFGADAELGLPEAELLPSVLREIDILHQTAVKWLEDL